MKFSIAKVTLKSLAPYSSSRQHGEPMLEGEGHDDYDRRTWRSKLNVEIRDGKPTIVLPAHGLMQCIAAAAKYSKKQIRGQGKATWTSKFSGSISIPESPSLNIDPETVTSVTIPCNPQGMRGGSGRVPRRFPIIPEWETTFDCWILDPIITETIFREMVEIAGLFIGIGRFRPEKGGINGRFRLERLIWQDNRELAEAAE
jgi:hypothetical protein